MNNLSASFRGLRSKKWLPQPLVRGNAANDRELPTQTTDARMKTDPPSGARGLTPSQQEREQEKKRSRSRRHYWRR